MSEPSQPTPPSGPEAPGAPVPPTEPPAPPAPPVPPVPQYGEYAPAGYVPPQPAPGFEAAAAAAQSYGTHPNPVPAGVRTRKTWDLVLTIVLFVLGFFGALFGVVYGAIFSDPALLDQTFQAMGRDGFHGTIGAAPAVLIVSHVVLYLVAIGGGLALLLTKRVAFWLPLAIGVVAAIIFWVTVYGVFLSDPNLVSTVS